MPDFLIIGQGSMGKRRVRCLLANGVVAHDICVYDTLADRLAESAERYGVRTADSIALLLDSPALRAVFVSVPGALHLDYCLAAARAGKHWFCEVPLALGLHGLDELFARTRQGLVGAPGCQVLFHPLAQALRAWSQAPTTGRILGGSYSFGSYLPDWHRYEDYRGFYASSQALGGGNLDVIAQELVWLRWIVGQPLSAVTCRQSKVGPLELAGATPDHQELIVEFASGMMFSMHFDLNDRTHERWLRLTTESSTAKWSTLEPLIRLYDAASGRWSEERLPDNFEHETVYHMEVAQFLRSIDGGDPWPVELETAREIVALLLAMQLSSAQNRTVRLQDVS